VLLQINKDHARPSEPNDFEHAGEDVNRRGCESDFGKAGPENRGAGVISITAVLDRNL